MKNLIYVWMLGHVMVLWSQYRYGEMSSLVSPVVDYTRSGGGCLSFNYYMSGSTKGSLSVTAVTNGGKVSLWSQEVNHGNRWLSGAINITADVQQVQLDGTLSHSSFPSLMLLDDVILSPGLCNKSIKGNYLTIQ